jgi:hypothetical protein
VRLAGAGLEADVPSGWDARIYSRPLAAPEVLPEPQASPFHRRVEASGGTASLHAASFALPLGDGDFGTGATSSMPAAGAFVAVLEYEVGGGLRPGVGLFAARGAPVPLGRRDFDPRALLRPRPGQLGAQRFFTAGGRPFCLYAVLGSEAASTGPLDELNRLLGSLRFGPALGIG